MRKNNKPIKRRLMITLPLTIIIIVISLITTTKELIKINGLAKAEKELSNELTELKEESESLNTEITKLNDPIYIARYARENYLYSKDGEIVVILDDAKTEEEIMKKADNKNLFIGIATFVIIILSIFLFIFKKKKKKR